MLAEPGVYFLFDHDEIVYVGKTNNVYYRVGQHIEEGVKKFDSVEFLPCKDNTLFEAYFINILRPKYNKAIPLRPDIKLNIKERQIKFSDLLTVMSHMCWSNEMKGMLNEGDMKLKADFDKFAMEVKQ